jgi:hypothetical protein
MGRGSVAAEIATGTSLTVARGSGLRCLVRLTVNQTWLTQTFSGEPLTWGHRMAGS